MSIFSKLFSSSNRGSVEYAEPEKLAPWLAEKDSLVFVVQLGSSNTMTSMVHDFISAFTDQGKTLLACASSRTAPSFDSTFKLVPNVGVIEMIEGRARYDQLVQYALNNQNLKLLPYGGSGLISIDFSTNSQLHEQLGKIDEQVLVYVAHQKLDAVKKLVSKYPVVLVGSGSQLRAAQKELDGVSSSNLSFVLDS